MVASLSGNHLASQLKGMVYFYPVNGGILVEIEAINMSYDETHPYALHIHE